MLKPNTSTPLHTESQIWSWRNGAQTRYPSTPLHYIQKVKLSQIWSGRNGAQTRYTLTPLHYIQKVKLSQIWSWRNGAQTKYLNSTTYRKSNLELEERCSNQIPLDSTTLHTESQIWSGRNGAQTRYPSTPQVKLSWRTVDKPIPRLHYRQTVQVSIASPR